MYSVSDTYKELSTASTREYHLIFTCYHLTNGVYEKYAEYTTDNQPIISAKIVNGQTTGGFTIGGTICASLTMTIANSMPVKVNDKINVFVLFETPYAHTASSEALSLGQFYVDSVQAGDKSTQIIALDKMMKLAKDYNSTLTYPSSISKIFDEIAQQTKTPVSENINVFNDAKVPVKPVKGQDSGGNDVYFTRREVLGYIAGINGGNAYIDKNGEINISIPKETGVTIDYSNVISQTLNDTSLEIKDININTSGTSQSTKDDLDDNTVELYYPISFDTSILETLRELVKALIGLKYDSVVLKKQGTGMFEPGDMISYKAADNKVYKMLLMGIVYDFSGGFFSETLYSLAKSEAQKQYAGVENISQNIASSGTNGATNEQNDLIEYEYLTDTSVKYNGKTYTVVLDEETGLISKITDDQEGEFKPTINSDITDTTLHNAVFWAIAMLSKLPKKVLEFDGTGIFGYYEYDNLKIDDNKWSNTFSTDIAIILSAYNREKENRCLRLMPGNLARGYGRLTSPSYAPEPMTIYVLFKTITESNPNYYYLVLSKAMTATSEEPYGFDIVMHGDKICLSCDAQMGEYDYTQKTYQCPYEAIIESDISALETHVVCITKNNTIAKLYIDGKFIGSQTCKSGNYHGFFSINEHLVGATRIDHQGDNFYRMLAFGLIEHTAEQVANNSQYIIKKYGKI